MNSQMISLAAFMVSATAWMIFFCFIFVYLYISDEKSVVLSFQKRIEYLKTRIKELDSKLEETKNNPES